MVVSNQLSKTYLVKHPVQFLIIADLSLSKSLLKQLLNYFIQQFCLIWGVYLNMDSTKWDKCEIEQTHLQFCEHILGINRSSTNHLTRQETGRYPIKSHIDYRILIFHKHILSMPQDAAVYQALLMDKNLHRSNASQILTLTPYIESLNFMNLRHVQESNHNLENSNKKTNQILKIFLFHNFQSVPKQGYIYNTKQNLDMNHTWILLQIGKSECNTRNLDSVIITLKLKRSPHESGRRQQAYCKLCTAGDIGDKLHLLFGCKILYKSRPSFLNYVYKKFSHTKQLDDTRKFIFLSKNGNKTMIKKFSEYVYELFNERYKIRWP